MSSEIVSFLQSAKRRFGDFAKISFRVSGKEPDGAFRNDYFLHELATVPSPDRLYLRIAVPYTVRTYDITPQLLVIQRALRKHWRK